jgi:hypothetical protein
MKFHSIWEHIKNEEVWNVHIQSNDQTKDILTKVLLKVLFENYKQILGLMNLWDLNLRRMLWVLNSKFRFWRTKSSGTWLTRETPCRTRKSSNNKDEHISKTMFEMNRSLIAQEHQGTRDEVLTPMMNMTLLTSVTCVKDNWWK